MLCCTKFGKNVTIKGKVVNPLTSAGIEGVEIALLKGTIAINGGFKAVKKTTSDSNGDFEINKLGLNHYDLRAQAGDRYDLGWFVDGEKVSSSTDLLSVKKGKTMYVEYRTVEYGSLNFNIENQNCTGPTDEMQFRYKAEFEPESDNYSVSQYGCYSFNSSTPTKVPSGRRTYEIKVTRPTGTTYVYDTVFIPPNGTATINLFY